MKKKIGVLCFSPTGTTKKVCTAIASGMGSGTPLMLDMTVPKVRAAIIADPVAALKNADHWIIGAPVYAGKLPLQVIECLRALEGAGKECSAVVVYGNRDYGIALQSMAKMLINNGFSVIAACVFIGQHSYSDLVPVAMGRPDASDLEKARGYGTRIARASGGLEMADIPVQLDMISRSGTYASLKPAYIKEKCVQCGRCAKTCPAGILSPETGRYLDRKARRRCLGCVACVQNCKQGAKVLKGNAVEKAVLGFVLRHARRDRNEPFVVI